MVTLWQTWGRSVILWPLWPTWGWSVILWPVYTCLACLIVLCFQRLFVCEWFVMFIPVVWQVSCMHGIHKWLSKDCQIYLIPHCSSRHLYSTFVITLHFLLMENHMGMFLSSIIINLPFIITNCFVDIGAIAEFLEWYWFVEHWPFFLSWMITMLIWCYLDTFIPDLLYAPTPLTPCTSL